MPSEYGLVFGIFELTVFLVSPIIGEFQIFFMPLLVEILQTTQDLLKLTQTFGYYLNKMPSSDVPPCYHSFQYETPCAFAA